MVLFFAPTVVPVTFTEKVQELLAARVAPVMLIKLVPAIAVIVPPPQEPDTTLGDETTIPAGRVSLNPILDKVVAVLLF